MKQHFRAVFIILLPNGFFYCFRLYLTVLDDIIKIFLGQGFLIDQSPDNVIQILAVFRNDPLGLIITAIDDFSDFLIYLIGNRIGI